MSSNGGSGAGSRSKGFRSKGSDTLPVAEACFELDRAALETPRDVSSKEELGPADSHPTRNPAAASAAASMQRSTLDTARGIEFTER